MSTSDLDSGDVLGSNLALACYYTGYLTIKGYDVEYGEYTLGYPNQEVRNGFFKNLMQAIQGGNSMESQNFVRSLRRFVRKDDIDSWVIG